MKNFSFYRLSDKMPHMRIISIAFQKYQISTGKIQLRFFYSGLPKLSLSNLFFPLFFQLFFFLFFTAKVTPSHNKLKNFFPLLQIEQQNVTYTNKKDASNAFKKHKKTRRMRSKNTKRRVQCAQKTQKDACRASRAGELRACYYLRKQKGRKSPKIFALAARQ